MASVKISAVIVSVPPVLKGWREKCAHNLDLRHRNGFQWCFGDEEGQAIRAGSKTLSEVQESSIKRLPYPQ